MKRMFLVVALLHSRPRLSAWLSQVVEPPIATTHSGVGLFVLPACSSDGAGQVTIPSGSNPGGNRVEAISSVYVAEGWCLVYEHPDGTGLSQCLSE